MSLSTHMRRRFGVAVVAAMLAVGTPLLSNGSPVDAIEFASGGFVTSAQVDRPNATVGDTVAVSVSVTSNVDRKALIDVEIYDRSGRKVFQKYWDNQTLSSGRTHLVTTNWATGGRPAGSYTVKIGVFGTGWRSLIHWNGQAAAVNLTTVAPTTTAPTTTTVAPTTTAPATTTTTTTTLAPTTTVAPTTTAPPTTTPVAVELSTSAASNPSQATPGGTAALSVTMRSDAVRSVLLDLEVYSASGQKVFQFVWDKQSFSAGQTRTVSTNWTLPSSLAPGNYTLKVGVFGAGWGSLIDWNNTAGTITVGTSPTTTTPPTSTTSVPPVSDRFVTLGVGAVLPSGAECAARVRDAGEIRPENAVENNRRGSRANANTRTGWSQFSRVDGDFAGSTDEIIQWAACKWGIDEDIARAQVIKESYWYQSANGDSGQSWGLGQVRDTAHQSAFQYPVNARTSSAYNLDYTYASWRACYEGVYTWLNNVERNGTYAAGDQWGCLGVWFSGRWYVNNDAYLNKSGDSVRWHYANKTWLTTNFING